MNTPIAPSSPPSQPVDVTGNARGGREGMTSLAASVPLLLLPIRIETRFVDGVGGVVAGGDAVSSSTLLVRIYPDTVSVASFEAELTADEVAAGKAYWNLIWAAGSPPPKQDAWQAPWRVLAAAWTPPRAAWIARALTPTNLAEQPAAPTPDGTAPDPAPVFPAPKQRASSYEQAPTVAALPDAWQVLLYRGDVVRSVTSNAITGPLAVGLTPRGNGFSDGLPVDTAMRWLVDFEEAEKVGMGIRIPLNATESATGFERIIVFGVCDEKQDGTGDSTLAALLDAHHYTDGVSFVPQGAPTNNTADASAAFSRKDPDYATSFAVERRAPLTADAAADGPLAAAALGLPIQTFDHVGSADGYGTRNAVDMLTALWPATLGYLMDQMLAPVFTADQIEAARKYALTHAVPRGALPALRVGNTPYGLLAVTSLANYPAPQSDLRSSDDPEALLAGFVQKLLPVWQASVAQAPHVGASADPDADLVQVLGMDASSLAFRARHVIGDDVMWNLLQLLVVPANAIAQWWAAHLSPGRMLLDSLGLVDWDPRLAHVSLGAASYPVPFPTVQQAPLSETAPLQNDAVMNGVAVNYIEWIRDASVADQQNEAYPGPKPDALLYRILRQSMLREYMARASAPQVAGGILPTTALREAELVNVRQSTPSVTGWDILARPIAAGSRVTWAQYLHDLQPAPDSPFAPLGELKASLGRLAGLSTAELDRLLTETLDACSHRLDVWVSSIATAILQRQRAAGQKADAGAPTLHLGGYGWVENVRPAARRATVSGAEERAVATLDRTRLSKLRARAPLASPVLQPQNDNGGFILAPSMTQAAAAAVLRSGYLSHRSTPDEASLQIDLSSDRVRNALWLLDGARQGQTLAALTGYAFEQALHDANLDVYIQSFRDLCPLIGDELTPQSTPAQTVTPSLVVDGLKLRTLWQAGQFAAGTDWGSGLPAASDPAQALVLAMIAAIEDRMDGLGDLSIAESVYQIMRGNFGRAGGILDAASRGDHPPQPDIVDTPRSGTDITHRLMLLIAGEPNAVPGWSSISPHPRARLEPWLEAWVASRLPDPRIVRCVVSASSGGAAFDNLVKLSDLDIGALDLLTLATAGAQPQRSELEQRILLAAGLPAGSTSVAISYAAASVPAGSITFPDLLVAAGALRDLLFSARPLVPQSFSLPEDDASQAGGATDVADLNARIGALLSGLASDITALQNALVNVAAAPQPVLDALLSASAYGIVGSVPIPGTGAADLATQASAVLVELQKRQKAAQSSPLPVSDANTATTVAQAILGNNVMLLPRLTPPAAAALQGAFAQGPAMRAVDPTALDRWLLQLSHIRPAAQRLDLTNIMTTLLSASLVAPLELAQLPPIDNDRWLGLPIDPKNPPGQGRVAIEALALGTPATQTPYAGLMIDEWVERIPGSSQSAGVSFHYDEPKSRAPQSLLLAVCPDGRAEWDPTLVRAILEETLALAKVRTVDLAAIQRVGQLLPGLYFPFNVDNATPSTHFLDIEAANVSQSQLGQP